VIAGKLAGEKITYPGSASVELEFVALRPDRPSVGVRRAGLVHSSQSPVAQRAAADRIGFEVSS